MKQTFLLIILFAAGTLHAQDAKKFQHEVGVDIYPIAKSIFTPASWGPFGNPVTDMNSVMYRLTWKNTFAFRTRVMVDYNYYDGSKTTTTNDNRTTTYEIFPSTNTSSSVRLGFQYNKTFSEKAYIYVAADMLIGKQYYNYGVSNSTSIKNAPYENVTYAKNTSSNGVKSKGAVVSAGISARIYKKFAISYELSYNFIRNNTASENHSVYGNATYYNGAWISGDENKTEMDNKSFEHEVRFMPMSIFMLSYMF